MSSSDVYSEDDDELSNTPSITPRSARGTQARALKALRSSLLDQSIESYSELFDQTFQKPETDETFNTTQNGVVIWTPQEKRILFDTLDRKGRNGIREIAATIGSKSELEVQEYIRLLQKGVRRQHFNDGHSRTAVLGEIPAAAEISEQCCDSLDQHAELLCLEEQRLEDSAGRQKHADLWIIDGEVAEELEADAADDSNDDLSETDQKAVQANQSHDGMPVSTPDLGSTAALFKLPNWITLSDRLFMNSGGQRTEDNWANIAFKGETPSMTADVAIDFHDIAVSITRRLVQAVHFFAASRIQRNRITSRPSAAVVKASDVRSAARTLNMKPDSSDYWIGLARRCSLDVEDTRHRKGWNPIPLSHDEVEALLSQRELPVEPYETSAANPIPRDRASSVTSIQSVDSLGEESTDSEDDHAEAVDRHHSSAEEILCWNALDQSPPEPSKLEPAKYEIPPKPPSKRKTTEELVDWRDRTLYRSEWEEFGYETKSLESELETQRKKPRLLALSSIRPLSESKTGVVDPNPESTSSQGNDTEAQTQPHANSETDPQTDASDTEFRAPSPGQPQSSKPNSKPKSTSKPTSKATPSSKPAISRTSSRKRTPVSYAIRPISDFDAEMEMDVDVDGDADADSGLEGGSAGDRDSDSQLAKQGRIEDGEDDQENEGVGAGDRGHGPGHRGGFSEPSDDEYDEYQDDEHLLSGASDSN